MHRSSFGKMARFCRDYLEARCREPLTIIDLGSHHINGCYRPIFQHPRWRYLGVDLAPGKNVDLVLRDPYDWRELSPESADVIVAGQTLESIRLGCRYEQVLGNIIALRDLRHECGTRQPAFVFNFVMMNRNIHEAPAFVRMAQALGAESIDFRHMVPIATYFSPNDLLSEHPGKYNFYHEQIVSAAKQLGIPIYLPPPFAMAQPWSPPVDQPPVDWRDFEGLQSDPPGDSLPRILLERTAARAWEGWVAEEFSTTFCNRPFSEIMVRDQNEVLPCPFHEKPLGFLSEGKTLAKIFHGEALTPAPQHAAAGRRSRLRQLSHQVASPPDQRLLSRSA
jgi:hypothetical protein